MKSIEKLHSKNKLGKVICVGLDTDINKIPVHLKTSENPVLEFNRAIIESTSKYAAAFKINFAFYESEGIKGIRNLEKTLSLLPGDTLVIADAKRGDIGNTSSMYAKSVFDVFNFDAVTIHPYMGKDSVAPFLEYEDKLNFILALTSNRGADDFEKLKLEDGSFLFQNVIRKVNSWNEKGNCGIVFGATKTEELKDNINSFGNLAVLLPGVGAQGGSLEDTMKIFKEKGRTDVLINVSRGILYKSKGEDFAEAARNEIIALNKVVDGILE